MESNWTLIELKKDVRIWLIWLTFGWFPLALSYIRSIFDCVRLYKFEFDYLTLHFTDIRLCSVTIRFIAKIKRIDLAYGCVWLLFDCAWLVPD